MKVGVIGAAGYTGGELIRLLLHHPEVEFVSAVSVSQSGKKVHSVHTDLKGETDLVFDLVLPEEVDLFFLCKGHGQSTKHLALNPQDLDKKIIDLSTDFRPRSNELKFVYGLPELNKADIQLANHIANPGCFATSIQLALLPFATKSLINDDVHIHAITGSTGAGQKPRTTTHFSWRNNNLSIYKLFEHQHLSEISESLRQAQTGFDKQIHFVPMRGDFPRGILSSIYTQCDLDQNEVMDMYTDYYQAHPFVHVTDEEINLKEVVNTNKCFLQLRIHGRKLHVTSVIDNLLKGASGQAIQNMNLMNDWDEKSGLRLKPAAF